MPTLSIAEKDILNYDCSWKATTLGYVKEVDPTGFKLMTKDVMVGKWGEVVVDKIVIGMAGSIKTTLEQVKVATVKQLCPWWTSGTVPLMPATRHQSLYALAGQLILHPVGDGTTDNDFTFPKAFPIWAPAKADGKEYRVIEVEWLIFPDQSVLGSTNVPSYGTGGPPA